MELPPAEVNGNGNGNAGRGRPFRWILLLLVAAGLLAAVYSWRRTEPMTFNKPTLLAALPGGGVAVYDSGHYRVVLLDQDLQWTGVIRNPLFEKIWGMDVSASQEVVLANERYMDPNSDSEDTWTEIHVYSLAGELKRLIRLRSGTQSVEMPGSIRILHDGSFLLTDLRGNRVVQVLSDGRVLRRIEEKPPLEGGMYYPNDVRRLADGRLLVVESYHSRLRLFDPGYQPLLTLAEQGTAEGQLMFPQFTALDDAGNLYLTELYTMRVSVFDRELKFQRVIEPQRSGVKEDPLQLFGVAVLRGSNRLLLADSLHSSLILMTTDGQLQRVITTIARPGETP